MLALLFQYTSRSQVSEKHTMLQLSSGVSKRTAEYFNLIFAAEKHVIRHFIFRCWLKVCVCSWAWKF